MADSPKPPESPNERRKREPPTIDLTATEMPEGKPASADAPRGEANEQAEPQRGRLRDHLNAAVLVAGVTGAAAAVVIVAVAWAIGLVSLRAADSGTSNAQLATLQRDIEALQARPQPDAAGVADLRARLARLEQQVTNLPASDRNVSERLSAADNALKSLGVALTALNRRIDDASAAGKQGLDRAEAADKKVTELQANSQAGARPAEVDSLRQRIAALEQASKTTREEMASAAASDQAARLALAAVVLREAAASGAPFSAELAQVKSLGADDASLAPLTKFAAAGLPSKEALARELAELLPRLTKLSDASPPPSGFIGRLEANAGKLVRIRPAGAPTGDDPADVLARLDADAAKANIDAALADLAKLPEAAHVAAQSWIDKAKARQDAITAASRLVAQSVRALGK